MSRSGFLGRVFRLEQAAPADGDRAALRERIERARARSEATMSVAERIRRASPEFLAAQPERQARHNARIAALSAGGRRPTLAERIIAGRELSE